MNEVLTQLVESVELLDVLLKKSDCLCKVFPLGLELSEVEISSKYESSFNFNQESKALICFVASRVTGDIDNEQYFYFHNQFALVYRLKEMKKQPSDGTLKQFLNTTALFNAYPYHREQVQGQSVKMGLPPIIMPLLKSIPEEGGAKK